MKGRQLFEGDSQFGKEIPVYYKRFSLGGK